MTLLGIGFELRFEGSQFGERRIRIGLLLTLAARRFVPARRAILMTILVKMRLFAGAAVPIAPRTIRALAAAFVLSRGAVLRLFVGSIVLVPPDTVAACLIEGTALAGAVVVGPPLVRGPGDFLRGGGDFRRGGALGYIGAAVPR